MNRQIYILAAILGLIFMGASSNKAFAQKKASEYYNEATQAAQKGEHVRAIELYSTAMSLDPTNDIPIYSRGCSRMKIGDTEGAVIDFSRAIELNPSNHEAYYNLGVIEYLNSEPDKAAQYFRLALKTDINNTPAMLQLAKIAYEQQDIENALIYFEMTVENDKVYKILGKAELHYAYKYFASCQSIIKDFNFALLSINRALDYDKTLYDTYYIRGSIYIELERYSEAVADLNEALRLKSDFGYGYFVRAMAYRKMGNTPKAQEDFARAKEFGYIVAP